MIEPATEYNLSGEPRLSVAVDLVTTVEDGEFLERMLPDLDRRTVAS